MPTVPLRRDFTALLVVWSLLCAQACYAYQRPPVGTAREPGARMRVQSVAPFAVRPAPLADTAVLAADCRATLVEGVATTASADVVSFQSLTRLVSANPDGRSCHWTTNAAVIVPTEGADVTVNRFSGSRTAVLLIMVAATYFAVVAYAASQFKFPPTGGGDCAFC